MPVEWRLRDMSDYALDFDGAGDDKVEIPTPPTLDPGESLTVRATADQIGSADHAIYPGLASVSSGGSFDDYLSLKRADGTAAATTGDVEATVRIEPNNGNGLDSDPFEYTTGEPVSIAVVARSNGDIDWYVDGESLGTATRGFDFLTLAWIGMGYGGATNNGAHDGVIDDFRHHSVELTGEQIDAHARGETIDTDGKVWIAFDDGSGTTASDSSGTGNDGSINGDPQWVVDTNPFAIDSRLLDVPKCTLAYNRFARSAKVELDDADGTIPTEYPRGAPVELEVKRDVDSSFSRRLGGFVNGYDQGQQTTTLKLLSHDAWIRSRDVYRSYSATAISTILNDLITELTPLKWDSSRVDVFDDKTIDADWSGVPLDSVITEIASASNDEIFGATDGQVFFFEQRDSERAPRDFGAGEYLDASFEEDGNAELNEVTIYYGGNPASSAVVVEDRESQKALQDELGAARPVVISDSKTYTDISAESAARRKGREILEQSSAIQTGELTTWEAFGVDPGDVTSVDVAENDVVGEYRVAEITHSWKADETTIKLAENRQGVVDTLVELSDEVSRVDARAADNNATITRFTRFDLPFEVHFSIEAYRRSVPAEQLLFGPANGGWGDTRTGGGLLGDQRGDREQIL